MKALAYIRTSSLSNVGPDKDSHKRQLVAINDFAGVAGYDIAETFSDEGVAGSENIWDRSGFNSLVDYSLKNRVDVVIVESASRFSRDLITQLVGLDYLKKQGITLIASDNPSAFTEDTPTATMVQQILGAVSQFEKSSLVAKLAGARKRIRNTTGKCEGKKGYFESKPSFVKEIISLRQQGLTLQKIADKVSEQGHKTKYGNPIGSGQIYKILKLYQNKQDTPFASSIA